MSASGVCVGPNSIINSAVAQDFSANNSLPVNTSITEGDNATFECELGTINLGDTFASFDFQYKLATQDVSVWNRSCIIGELLERECWVNRENDDRNYVPSLEVLRIEHGYNIFRFTFQVLNADMKHNNSVFSCSISSGDQLQWLHSAHLTMTRNGTLITHQLTESEGLQQDNDTLNVAVSAVVVLLVVVAALTLTGGGMLARRKWRRKRMAVLGPDQGMG